MSASAFTLGIETSCDDTAVALVSKDGTVKGSISSHQDSAHAPFGGVVPEVASRQHTENLLPLIDRLLAETSTSWDQIAAIAVTSRPGLIGSLLVGVVTGKTLALAKDKPLIGVNHIEGHLIAPLLRDAQHQPPAAFGFPYLGLAVSGGHTHLFHVEAVGKYHLMGQTRDDAAGEALDKFAKLIGLGFPGGARVDKEAQGGSRTAFPFPRPLLGADDLDFSFSGMKTSAQRLFESLNATDRQTRRADLCASFQGAVVDVLIEKLGRAAARLPNVRNATITGGVSANSELRRLAEKWAKDSGRCLALPPVRFCTDNAAMIALAGSLRLQSGARSDQSLSPSARSLAGDFL